MKKLLPILLIFFSLPLLGHQDYIASLNRNNIHFEFTTSWNQFEINQKFDILLELTDSLIDANNLNKTPIYISFDHDYTKSDTNFTFISFDHFEYWDSKNNARLKYYDNGLIINICDEDIKIAELLNLIYYSIINQDYIKDNVKKNTINSRFQGTQTFNSIPSDSVNKYKSANYKAVNQILNLKVYRNIKPISENREIDYYYQNGRFHFYNTREPNRKWNSELKEYEIIETFGEDILVVDNILEILGSYNDGHFVFVNDSLFYYIPHLKNKVIGPLTINSITPGRQPILKYYRDNFENKERAYDKFTLFICEYVYYRKVLVIPDCSLVVGNYDHLESEFINGLIEKKPIYEDITATKEVPNNSFLYLSIIAVLTIILIYILLRRK